MSVIISVPKDITIRQCHFCSSKRSSPWYKDPSDPTLDRCKNCYRKTLREREGVACGKCLTNISTQWYKDKVNRSKYLCEKCYRKALLDREGISCSKCETTKAKLWRKDPEDSAKYRCQRCFYRAKSRTTSEKSKARKVSVEKEETVLRQIVPSGSFSPSEFTFPKLQPRSQPKVDVQHSDETVYSAGELPPFNPLEDDGYDAFQELFDTSYWGQLQENDEKNDLFLPL